MKNKYFLVWIGEDGEPMMNTKVEITKLSDAFTIAEKMTEQTESPIALMKTLWRSDENCENNLRK